MTNRAAAPFAAGVVICLVAILLPTFQSTAGAVPSFTCGGKLATIVGTPAKDRIVGTSGDDVIVALGGADVIYGGGGRDTICGGDGPDKIYGGRHSDTIFGEQGNDRIAGEAGADVLSGGTGRDIVIGGAGNDDVSGQGGGDRRLKGGDGADATNGGSGIDRCEVAASDSSLQRCEVDIAGRPIGAWGGSQDPRVVELYDLVEDEILPTHGADHPWIGIAWQHITTNGTVESPENSGGYVQTQCSYSSDQLATCESVLMNVGSDNNDKTEVVLHELAHVYEQTTALADNRSAMGIALMYIEVTYDQTPCAAEELLADAMVRTVLGDSIAPYWRFNCGNSVPPNPTRSDMDVVRSGLADTDHPWFANRYQGGEQAWTVLEALPPRSELATAFADKFGGYCSNRHTNDVLYGGNPDSNPFRDGGC